MTSKKQKSSAANEEEFDPFDELNELDENLTIETEKDFFDEIEQSDLESVPQYDSESGKIIENSELSSEEDSVPEKTINNNKSFMETINNIEINSKKTTKHTDLNKSEIKDNNKIDLSQVKLSKPKSSMPKPKKPTKNLNADKTAKDTKIIDNVKVDKDGVPLLNQFDTEKIKHSSILPKITITKISFSKLIMIVLGLLITIIGILQAMNDVVRISDHVMYGEHESIAFGLIFLGIIIIILAFYKEIIKMVGLNNLTTVMDDIESPSEPKDKKNTKKK